MPNLIQSKYFVLLFAVAPLVVTMGGCSTTQPPERSSPTTLGYAHPLVYPSVDSGLSEQLYPHEKEMAEQISEVIAQSVREQYALGRARRDVHTKAHGCVRAEFHVAETLPQSLAKGIFIPGKTYQAWIRFSNGSRDASQADIKRDARGMAIKILAVSGKKLLENEAEASTQDFIMINHPVFFANDPSRYLSLMQDINSQSFLKKLHIPFALGAKGTFIALNTNSKISNPLQTRYWSMVPYQLGVGADRQAVKYSARSCSSEIDAIPKQPSPNFLRDKLRNTLQHGDACMQFLVQPRTSNSLSVEDSMTEWTEKQSPFYQVATIRIPQQVFDTAEQNAFCENLSFTPWHSLPEHKPLGGTNRLRKVIYDRISQVRHEMNAVPRQEPK